MNPLRPGDPTDRSPLEGAVAENPPAEGTSRRSFLKGLGFAVGAAAIVPGGARDAAAQPAAEATNGFRVLGDGARDVALKVNGQVRTVNIEPRTTLLETLRSKMGLTGAKEVCDRGTCGCCSVQVDGQTVCSCLMLAIDAEGHEVVTVEGIAADPANAAMIESFCEHDGAQCGYCIPGFVVRGQELLRETPALDDASVREGLTGNICRCGTYSKIFDSLINASAKGGKA